MASLPESMKALVLKSTDELPSVEYVPMPSPRESSAVIHILAGTTINFMQAVYTKGLFPLPEPMIPGTSAVGKVVAAGPDSTKVQPGDLAFFDCVIRSRDNPDTVYLSAVPFTLTEEAKNLRDRFPHGSFAEYCLSPLENLTVLNEARLTGSLSDSGLAYEVERLAFPSLLYVPYGGLKAINVQAGQKITVAPATGPFGGYAVPCAQAMGAHVIAMRRNQEVLAELKAPDLKELKKFGQFDVFFDIGPPAAYGSSHIKSAFPSLRHGARISFMGGYRQDVTIPYSHVMERNLTIQGRYMYERSDVGDIFKMIETGLLDLNVGRISGQYSPEKWNEAWDRAADVGGFANLALIKQ